MSDPRLRSRLDRLATPPPRAGFHEELMDKIRERERAALRRWRLATIVLAVVAAGAIAAAGVMAAGGGSRATRTVSDRTYSCRVAPNNGFPKLALSSRVTMPAYGGGASFGTTADASPGDDNFDFLWITTERYKDYALVGFDPASCRPTHRSVPLARERLPKDGTYTRRYLGGFSTWCRVPPGRVDVRLRVKLDAKGVPSSATIAVRSERNKTPIAYVLWSPSTVTSYLSPRCES